MAVVAIEPTPGETLIEYTGTGEKKAKDGDVMDPVQIANFKSARAPPRHASSTM